MTDRPSELRSGLPCSLCGRSLFPVPAGPEVTFHCKSGHAFDIRELLSAQSEMVRGAMEKLLGEWEGQARFLIECAEDARENGYPDIADLFARRAERLERKVESLRAAPQKDDSSKLVAVPAALIRSRPAGTNSGR